MTDQPEQWRSLEEAGAAGISDEGAPPLPADTDDVGLETSRRDFLRVMAASVLLNGLPGCGRPPELAVPYIDEPEEIVPGKPRFYAAATLFEGYAQPVLAETHVGRPTKLDGNPVHPVNEGGTDIFTQAAVLELYDPDRSSVVRHGGEAADWEAFEAAMRHAMGRYRASGGRRLRLLTGTVTSPTLARHIEAFLTLFPGARWHVFEPIGHARRHEATELAFGRRLDLHYRLEQAQVVVSLEEDLLGSGPAQVLHAQAWARRRREAHEAGERFGLYVAESTPSLTGAAAQSRQPVPVARLPALAVALADALGVTASNAGAALPPEERAWMHGVAGDLQRHRGRSLVAVGPHLPPDIQALVFRINEALGNSGVTIIYTEPVAFSAREGVGTLAELAGEMAAGEVEALIMLDINPVYTAPADISFAHLLRTVPLSVHAGLFYDETAALSRWHTPVTHALESWSDARAVDGTATILQPVVSPLFQGRPMHEVLAVLLGQPEAAAYDTVRETWRAGWPGDDFERRWRQALQAGFVADTAATPVATRTRVVDVSLSAPSSDAVEVVFRPDPTVWDGRYANSAWLQELPKPLTKLTWDNIAAVSPRLAEELKLGNGDVVQIAVEDRRVLAPIWVLPGQAARTVTVYLGYGRRAAGRVGDGIGYDAYAIRTTGAPWYAANATLRPTGHQAVLASTQAHHTMAGRDLVRTVPSAAARAAPEAERRPRLTLYPEWEYESYAWGMVIDLDVCTGCSACVLSCQAENSVPVVGKREVARGRAMHWLRIDRYYAGEPHNPETYFQPVPCMHCEKAPCELGCPVNATVHGPEGLNQMVYNRCIGTRTCASYCPYEVRRFNYFHYAADAPPSVQAQRNPDVTVRARGVMEKCTYCVQRISAARIEAKKAGRPIRDGEVSTACQDACPTKAIVFGDLNDPDSGVSRARSSPRNYVLLAHLNTWPRTTYLARVRSGGGEPKEER